jgi:hypothetical protein
MAVAEIAVAEIAVAEIAVAESCLSKKSPIVGMLVNRKL